MGPILGCLALNCEKRECGSIVVRDAFQTMSEPIRQR